MAFDTTSLTVTYRTPYNTHHAGTGSDLDHERIYACTQIIDVCTQRFNYNVTMYNF
jgi:hypothetical protein